MPQAIKKSAIGVGLELTDPKPSYLPGDKLTGHVIWSSQQICFVRLRLFGRVKTKIERKHATRARAMLFDVAEILYNGPPCATGQQARPFSINIPSKIQKDVKAGGDRLQIGIKDEWRDSPDFISTAQNNGDLSIPFSYYYAAATMGVKAEGFVEYVVQAETAVSERAAKNDSSLGVTSMPLVIRMPTTAQSYTRKIMTRSFPGNIVAHSTDADFDKTKLTLKQRLKKNFRPTAYPRYNFYVRVDAPTKIQLDDETPFSLKLSLLPDMRPERTNLCPDGDLSKLPPVRLVSFKLFLQSTTHVRCPASWMDDESDKMHEYMWDFSNPIGYTIPIGGVGEATMPPTIYEPGVRPSAPAPPTDAIDLGVLLKLRLTPFRTEALGAPSKQLPRPIWPSFKTFNINVSYDLMYEMGLECLGEKDTISNLNYAKSRVTVLPPSHIKDMEWKTKKGDFDPVALALDVGDIAWNIIQNVLF